MSRNMLLTSLVLLVGCSPMELDSTASVGLPLASGREIPSILRDVHLTDNDLYTYPVIPPFRTSADGRVAVDMKQRNPNIELFLLSPERLTQPVTAPGAPTGARIAVQKVELSSSLFYDAATYVNAGYTDIDPEHRTICDGTLQFGNGATVSNPHPCDPQNPLYADPAGTTDAQDCYNLTMITSVQHTAAGVKKVQLWGKPFAVVVDNPKRWDVTGGALATISQVDTYPGDPSKAPIAGQVFLANSVLEPMITADGHLLVGRLGKSNRDPNTGASRGGDKLDVVYSTYADTLPACDVTQWTTLHPISHAYADTNMHGRYGIAAYPLKDPQGNPIADGADAQVSYPWIDREGNNLFFNMMDATLYNNVSGTITPRYGSTCYQAGCPSPPVTVGAFEDTNNFHGVGFAGLWSHGRMVLLDNLLNNIDYGLGREDDEQVMLDLYQAGTNPDPVGDQSGLVRAGTGRDNGAPRPHPRTTENSAFIDSLEQLFNYNDNLLPLTVRDVVWTVNTGKTSAELAFDDYLDPEAVIVAEMSGAMEYSGPGNITMRYLDGFNDQSPTLPEDVRFQNAATSPLWTVPAYGQGHGEVRVEPVALGGIEGRGAWLDGNEDSISFDINLPDYQNRAWYLGIFVDPRFPDEELTPRQLVVFPDGSEISLVGYRTIVFRDAAGVSSPQIDLQSLSLSRGHFSHLGFVLNYPQNRIELYVDGFGYAIRSGSPLQLSPGELFVGDKTGDTRDGFVGWIDEFKLLAHNPGFEEKCNHARGTLMGGTANTGEPWYSLSLAYPQLAHDAISNQLTSEGYPSFLRYVCHHDYAEPRNASPRLESDPELTSIRTWLLFPEGPLEYDVERPDSSQNAFCLSCHHVSGEHGLGLAALAPGAPGVFLQDDVRRQPMMAPRQIFGNVPAYLFGTGPLQDLHTISHSIDQYEHPPQSP